MDFAGFRIVRISRKGTGTHPRVTVWIIAGAVFAFAAFLVLLGPGAGWLDSASLHGLTAEQRASEIDAMRGYLIQYGGGVFLFLALVYTARTFQLSREGHVTDRYTKAIEQLGSDHLDVRLGAIYALERIMIDSARDHPTIVEVLAAFVRGHAPYQPPAEDENPDPEYPLDFPGTDVIAAVTVLSRRPQGREERGLVNLQSTYLAYTRFISPNLSRVDLSDAFLVGAKLIHADLSGAVLNGADLSRAFLGDANLTQASLFGATMNDIRLGGANLTRASLFGANLRGALMDNADLTAADLTAADLTNADLTGTELSDEQRTAARGVAAPSGEPELLYYRYARESGHHGGFMGSNSGSSSGIPFASGHAPEDLPAVLRATARRLVGIGLVISQRRDLVDPPGLAPALVPVVGCIQRKVGIPVSGVDALRGIGVGVVPVGREIGGVPDLGRWLDMCSRPQLGRRAVVELLLAQMGVCRAL